VKRASKVRATGDPELRAAVETGKVSVNAAVAIADLPKRHHADICESSASRISSGELSLKLETRLNTASNAYGLTINQYLALGPGR
jgi:hypothetical protein